MAEAHPVGFQWVMEAKARGATIIHVDPRFSRTSAVANLHVPIRAGADIAFVGGLINYVLQNDKYFHDYVVNYTNAPTIIDEDFRDTEDLDGLFSGFDPEHRTYDWETWRYQGDDDIAPASGARGMQRHHKREVREAARGEAHGSGGAAAHPEPDTDPTLQHPRCVFQILKRHFARYTPEMVAEVAGVPEEQFYQVARAITENSGRDRTTAFVYSLGWTQHTVGVQYIRTAAILQALLGNMGRPGGGILAMRGHASIQGSTDIPTLFDLLPGYLPMPFAHAGRPDDLDAYVEAEKTEKGFWANTRDYMVSLLKAYWGDAATADNDFCFDYLPRLTGDHSTYETVKAQMDGTCQGLLPVRPEPGGRLGQRADAADGPGQPGLAGGPRPGDDRERHVLEERPGDRDRRDAHRGHQDRGVLHARRGAHREERQLHQHRADAAVAPHRGRAGRGRPQRPVVHLPPGPPRSGHKLAASSRPRWTGRSWTSPGTTRPRARRHEPDADAVLAEINGWDADGQPLSTYTQLKTDGSTACGCWIYCGVRAGGVNQAARRKPGREQNWVAGEWGWAWPANRRMLYNRASADPDGKPWSERKAYVWWDEEQGKWTGHDVPDFIADRPPSYRPPAGRHRGGRDRRHTTRSSCRPTARRGCSPRPAWWTARCPRTTSRRSRRCPTCSTGSSTTRSGRSSRDPEDRFQPSGGEPGSACSRT